MIIYLTMESALLCTWLSSQNIIGSRAPGHPPLVMHLVPLSIFCSSSDCSICFSHTSFGIPEPSLWLSLRAKHTDPSYVLISMIISWVDLNIKNRETSLEAEVRGGHEAGFVVGVGWAETWKEEAAFVQASGSQTFWSLDSFAPVKITEDPKNVSEFLWRLYLSIVIQYIIRKS